MAPSVSNLPSDIVPKIKPESAENDANQTYIYSAMPNLKRAIQKAGGDFRSDVSTVPTESMMQVRKTALALKKGVNYSSTFRLESDNLLECTIWLQEPDPMLRLGYNKLSGLLI